MAKEAKEALAAIGVSRQPIKLPSGEMTTEYQVKPPTHPLTTTYLPTPDQGANRHLTPS